MRSTAELSAARIAWARPSGAIRVSRLPQSRRSTRTQVNSASSTAKSSARMRRRSRNANRLAVV